jgi:hypothetical protein
MNRHPSSPGFGVTGKFPSPQPAEDELEQEAPAETPVEPPADAELEQLRAERETVTNYVQNVDGL